MYDRQRRERPLSRPVEIVWHGDAPVLITCEHASNELPEDYAWSEADERLRDMHWAIDHGAAELSRELARSLKTSAVLAGFTRLLVDPNREPGSPTMFRTHCDGIAVDLNRELDEAERERRLTRYYQPYHDAIDAEIARRPRRLVFAVHSFTPEYEGEPRQVKMGVLFDHWEAPGRWLAERLARDLPFDVALNEPWSGANGLMYSAHSHADRHGALALEIEVRQDLLVDPGFRAELLPVLTAALEELVA